MVNRGARPNMGLLATATTIGSVHHCTIEASERRGTAMGARTARKRLSEGKDEERGKEYCKLLLPLVSCLERWIVCLLPRRTRYCATYLRTHPRQKSSSISSLSSSSQHRRCRLRPVIAVLPGCNRSGKFHQSCISVYSLGLVDIIYNAR